MTQEIYRVPSKPAYVGGYNMAPVFVWLFLVVLVQVFVTQLIAHRLGYQRALGVPWFRLGEFAIYPFWQWMLWVFKYGNSSSPAVKSVVLQGALMAGAGGLASVFGAMWVNMRRHKKLSSGGEDLHGSARFANFEEVQKMGIVGQKQGSVVGGYFDHKTETLHYLRHNGPEHVLVFAPTRSGKGVSLVVPTLLSWSGSTMNNDLKGELWELTSGYRESMGHRCIRFAPVEADSEGFNPLAELRVGTLREVSDAQNIAEMIINGGEDSSSSEGSKHWNITATSIMTGVILHVCWKAREEGREPTLPMVAQTFTRPGQDFRDTLAEMMAYPHDPDRTQAWLDSDGNEVITHPVVAEKCQELLDKEDREFSGVLSTAKAALILYSDPLVTRNVSKSSFRIADLVNGDRPHDLYIIVPESDKLRLRPLIRLLYTMVVSRLCEKMAFKEGRPIPNKHRLLFMVDEFASLKRMELFGDALSYMAGYGLHAYLIVQDLQQIYDNYGQYQSIVGNCHIRIAFAPNDETTANSLSKMTGVRTIQRSSVNYSGSRMSPMLGQVNTSVEHVERELMTPDELMRLKPAKKEGSEGNQKIVEAGDMLIFVSGQYPIYGRQPLYFLDPVFSARAKMPPAQVHPKALKPSAQNGAADAFERELGNV